MNEIRSAATDNTQNVQTDRKTDVHKIDFIS